MVIPMSRLLAVLLLSTPFLLAASPSADRSVRVVYTGFTGGLSSGRADFAELWPYFKEQPALDRTFTAGGFVQDNAFRRGDYVAYTDHGPLTLGDFRGFFAASPLTVRTLGPGTILTTDYAHILDLGPAKPELGWPLTWLREALKRDGGFPDVRTTRTTRYQVTNARGLTLRLIDLSGAAPPAALAAFSSPVGWELLAGGAVALQTTLPTHPGQPPARVLGIGRTLGDGLRRAALAARWRDDAPGGTLAVDLGNILDPGYSDLSLKQRAFTMRQLGSLGLDGLVPAETELGLDVGDWGLVQAMVPVIAANLTPADANRAPPLPALIKQVSGLRVAIIGLVDDRAAIAAGVAGPRTPWLVSDPIEAARKTIADLEAAGRPDLVVLATNLRDERLQSLRHLNGAAVVLADMVGLPGDLFSEYVSLAGEDRARVRSSYLIARSSPNRVGRLDVRFVERLDGKLALAGIRNEARLVTDALPHDHRLRGQLNELLDRYQATRRELILPDLREAEALVPGFPAALDSRGAPHVDRSLWRRLIANLARTQTGAEIAIVRVPPMHTRVVGAVSRLVVEGWLEVGDRLIQVVLPGKALKAIALADTKNALAFSGYDPIAFKAQGLAVGDDDLFRVTTTDVVARHALFAEAFGTREPQVRWRTDEQGRAWLDAAGDALTLRDHVVRGLNALKARHRGAFKAGYFQELAAALAPAEAAADARWSVRLEDGELLTNNVAGGGDPAFTQVRNARVTAPSSQALGGKAKVAILWDSTDLALENRVKAAYKRATLTKDGKEITQETEDEVVLTSELRMKRWSTLVAGSPLTPFWSWNYTTEFKPDEANGLPKLRRQELAAIGGMLWAPGGGFKELRAGTAFKNDLANPGALEPGLYMSGGWEGTPFPAYPAKLRGGVEAFRYFASPTDSPDRLGLAATLTAGVMLPLWERFTLNVGGDWFVFQGKVPATEALRTSLDLKVGLGYSLVWKPLYGVWF